MYIKTNCVTYRTLNMLIHPLFGGYTNFNLLRPGNRFLLFIYIPDCAWSACEGVPGGRVSWWSPRSWSRPS